MLVSYKCFELNTVCTRYLRVFVPAGSACAGVSRVLVGTSSYTIHFITERLFMESVSHRLQLP